jgi:hypothetical protein
VLETAVSSAPALMEPQHARRLALVGPKIRDAQLRRAKTVMTRRVGVVAGGR